MPRKIKLLSIQFNEHKFRKLSNIKLDIAPRLTAISGHNGIGKSTILGIIANGSEYNGEPKTYFGKSFRSDFGEIFHLAEDEIVKDRKTRPIITLKYSLEYQESPDTINSIDILKNCRVSKQGTDRLRLIPRTDNQTKKNYKELLNQYKIGDAAKMPIPTIYLGMSRMTPIGEHDSSDVTVIRRRDAFAPEDQTYIIQATNKIIPADLVDDPAILTHSFKKSRKGSSLPEYAHSSLSISLGQDSLSSIITALASFHRLKRENPDVYTGGILVIDELDAGFHPIAQLKLIELFKQEARKLNLQIIFTTHSLTILKHILNEDKKQHIKPPQDTVIYFQDTRLPKLMPNVSYQKIKNDLLLTPKMKHPQKPSIDIFFEDSEAELIFKKIINHICANKGVYSYFGVEFNYYPLGTSEQVLMTLYDKVPYFKNQLLIPDNDVYSKCKNRELIEKAMNIVPLPGSDDQNENTPPAERTPEAILYLYIKSKFDNYEKEEEFWRSLVYTTDYTKEHILTLSEDELTGKKSRESKERWFNCPTVQNFLNDANIIEKWAKENHNSIHDFETRLRNGINNVLAKNKNN